MTFSLSDWILRFFNNRSFTSSWSYKVMKGLNLKITMRERIVRSAGLIAVVLFLLLAPSRGETAGSVARNSWRGITPLHSSAEDVAKTIGVEVETTEAMLSGPYKVEGGEVTFSYLTTSLAKIYRAPRSMVGKVFTIYFKPSDPMSRVDLALSTGFKRCVEERDRVFYYFVSDAGVAYRLLRDNDRVETIIYQPSRVEVRSLAVNTDCVF